MVSPILGSAGSTVTTAAGTGRLSPRGDRSSGAPRAHQRGEREGNRPRRPARETTRFTAPPPSAERTPGGAGRTAGPYPARCCRSRRCGRAGRAAPPFPLRRGPGIAHLDWRHRRGAPRRLSASSSESSPTGGRVSSRGSRHDRDHVVAARRDFERALRAGVEKVGEHKHHGAASCSRSADARVPPRDRCPAPFGCNDSTSRMTRSTCRVPLRGGTASSIRSLNITSADLVVVADRREGEERAELGGELALQLPDAAEAPRGADRRGA